MSGPRGAGAPEPEGPRGTTLALTWAMTTIGFFALAIAGFGMLSLLAERDLIDIPEAGQLPGILGMVFALAFFALVLVAVLRSPRASFAWTLFFACGTALAHLVGLWFGALLAGSGPATATAAVGAVILGGATLVVAVSALIASWAAIAVRRSGTSRPRWPWEGADDV